MPRLSKKIKKEMAFFINPATGKRQYNRRCRRCINSCTQSYRAILLACPKYQELVIPVMDSAYANTDRS